MRSFSISFIVGSLIFLIACGSNGTPSGVPVTLSVSANPSTLNPGQSSTITATVVNASNTGVTWSITSPSGFGTLSSTTANPTTYTAPATVSTTTPVTITATSAQSSSVTATAQIVVQGATVSLSPAAPQTINVGGTLPITATLTNTGTTSVTWSLSGVGSLSATSGSSITYSAPTSTTGTAKVTATSGSASTNLEITVLTSGAGPNVAGLSVGTGPVAYANGVLTSVLVCSPGSTTDCTTVDSVLVDTGSVGLRVLGSQIPAVALTPVTYSDGSQMNECVAFLDGSFLWGTVSAADIYIGGEKASSVPVQVIANPTGYSIPSSCSNGGTNEDTQATLGANGIIGVGPEPFDCGLGCDVNGNVSPIPDMYYASCTSASGCQPVYASCGGECSDSTPLQQVTNPVVVYAVDNNGTIISMTAPSGGAAPTATGTLVFGIGTEANNSWNSSLITLPLNSSDEFTTSGLGTAPPLQASFIDSGSNGLFFPNWVGLAVCSDNSDFYCSTAGPFTVTNISQVSSATGPASFSVADADTLFGNTSNQAFTNLAGPEQAGSSPQACSGSPDSGLSGDCTFDFGFPFFYGATIYTSIDGQNVPATAPSAPWFAY